jgi:hypothetical protein
MSDPQVPSATPTTQPSPVTQELGPNTVIHAPEPVAVAPAPVPEVNPDWKVNTLENGQHEVILNGGQKYTGTTEQVINELAKAQFNATQRIHELGRQAPVQQTNQPGPQIDPTAKALADLAAQGMGYANAEALQADLGGMRESYQQQAMNNVAAQFMATTPDFQPSIENGNKLDEALQQAGMAPTVQNLKIMHAYLKNEGQYVVGNVPQQQHRPPAMPMPPNGQAAPAAVEKSIWEMNGQEFAQYEASLRAGRA